MSVCDLGVVQQPMLVFGGPYSNLQATQAMRAEAETRGIAADHIVCTGDVIAYCADAQATVDFLMDWGVHVVMGNCEESLGQEADDCGCGFEEGTACSVLSVAWYRHANAQVQTAARAWMRQLPRSLNCVMGGKRVLLTHGSPASINEFVFASTSSSHKQLLLASQKADIVVAGHCGLPFASALENGWWLNAGVIGMPANDASPDTWYMMLEPAETGLQVSWHRLAYDVPAAQAAMTQAALPHEYRDALASGLWPSQDVLPPVERALRGQPILLSSLQIT